MNQAGTVATLNVTDGSPAPSATAPVDRFVVKDVGKAMALQCHDEVAKLVWERKGESVPGDQGYLAGKDCVVWLSKDGGAEVIHRTDGATLWQAKGLKEAQAYVDPSGTHLIVQSKKDVTIVKLAS